MSKENRIVERSAVNPWAWSVNFGFNQAEVVEGAGKVLFCSGQTSVDAEGSPQHPGDMAAQIALAADSLVSRSASRWARSPTPPRRRWWDR